MLMPSIYERNYINNLLDEFAKPAKYMMKHPTSAGSMKTDIQETPEGYEISMDLPGYKKENVKAELKDGFLTVTAIISRVEEKEDENSKYITRERFAGSCKRSFYVGEDIETEDVAAKFEDGVLKLTIPKKEPKEVEEKLIQIA